MSINFKLAAQVGVNQSLRAENSKLKAESVELALRLHEYESGTGVGCL